MYFYRLEYKIASAVNNETFFVKFLMLGRQNLTIIQFQTQDLKDSKEILRNICRRREQAGEGRREARVAQAQ